jgi:hypothetical protein
MKEAQRYKAALTTGNTRYPNEKLARDPNGEYVFYTDYQHQREQLDRLREALSKVSRLILPVTMTMAQEELAGEPIPDNEVVLHFMGSGASDQVTAGMIREAMNASASSLSLNTQEPK